MTSRTILSLLILAAGFVLFEWGIVLDAEEGVQLIPDDISESSTSPDPALFMQAKLSASQKVLAGLLEQDFEDVKAAADVLGKLAESATIRDTQSPRDRIYEHFRTEFIRLAGELAVMADAQNLEGAAYYHEHMTATCIACHRHLRSRQSSSPTSQRQPGSAAKPSADRR